MDQQFPDEWTQEQYMREKERLEKEGIKVLLIDTILSPIEKADTVVYNPHELKKESEGSVFVFYCDTGKATQDRLKEYRAKFPKYHCISLRGGRGYWRKNMQILPDNMAAGEEPKADDE
jgi:predicted PolB exonuclease-like 3'-5' exonuclease